MIYAKGKYALHIQYHFNKWEDIRRSNRIDGQSYNEQITCIVSHRAGDCGILSGEVSQSDLGQDIKNVVSTDDCMSLLYL